MKTHSHTYFVKNIHCASCEILIERKLLEIPNIKFVDVSSDDNSVYIEYTDKRPSINQLNNLFEKEGYVFTNKEDILEEENSGRKLLIFISTLIIIFALFNFSNYLANFISVDTTSSLIYFVILGFVASLSSCSAVVGGIILSISKSFSAKKSDQKFVLINNVMFQIGRLFGYALVGAILGFIGNIFSVFNNIFPFIIIFVSIYMIYTGLNSIGIKLHRKFSFFRMLPKFRFSSISSKSSFLIGAFTVFIPCGFTLTVQSIALVLGDPIRGALAMFFFALGTSPVLFGLGMSKSFLSKFNLGNLFSFISGVLLIFFGIFNINSQLNVLGFPSMDDIIQNIKNIELGSSDNTNTTQNNTQSTSNLALVPIENGKQILRMNASAYGYSPNHFVVQTNIPILWVIKDNGSSGCTNAIIAKDLFSGTLSLIRNGTTTKEFTIKKPGKYKFSCWMGMYTGTIEAVDTQ